MQVKVGEIAAIHIFNSACPIGTLLGHSRAGDGLECFPVARRQALSRRGFFWPAAEVLVLVLCWPHFSGQGRLPGAAVGVTIGNRAEETPENLNDLDNCDDLGSDGGGRNKLEGVNKSESVPEGHCFGPQKYLSTIPYLTYVLL